ncbi:hypothetical protein L1785_04615 [Antribacter sp. KLBMP9083]|uniref:Uncharacterized protein n=1 Tax=Antribacter soli TaxID=2910976 RepID=A0AA41U893_9MICO|nr:hypothetical protein [Antribacter soli]MCF4120257.1 hypothetical protein [Antribacter soli]
MRSSLRLSSLLRFVGAFSGPLPVAPPAGFARPAVPDDVSRALAVLTPARRRAVLDPLGRDRGTGTMGRPRRLSLPSAEVKGGVPASQVDETTCGSAVLAMLGLAGDPRAALRLATGDAGANFAGLQRAIKRATNRRALGAVGWPERYGTPPWGAASVARYGVVRYTHRVVGAAGRRPRSRAVLLAAVGSARAGVPVPLFTGGDVARGLETAIPRHVVLLTLADGEGRDGSAVLYEPSSAALHTVPVAALLDPPDAGIDPATPEGKVRAALTRALGGWPHVTWALLPAGRA